MAFAYSVGSPAVANSHKWRYNSEKVTETREMNIAQRRQLANLLKNRRQKLGLSANETARRAGINQGNYWRIEAGEIAKPNAEKLGAIGHVLGIPISELFSATGWMPPAELPALRPYLRTRYHLPPQVLAKLEASVTAIAGEYGISIERGPARGEDEHLHTE
ncbi:helix-turn-helix domain-containing protein [Mycobacteroides sp. PCS013]|uniref:helix-turn-helix domain-containing protein n=1 Tax=Mycobacteroides sp. PCS013 TaxID=3074106 RepID=UPI003C2D264B